MCEIYVDREIQTTSIPMVSRGIGTEEFELKKQELYEFAKTIGSDVPVCLYSKHAFFKGYGEILSKAPKLPKFSIILINSYWNYKKGEFINKPKQLANEKNISPPSIGFEHQ